MLWVRKAFVHLLSLLLFLCLLGLAAATSANINLSSPKKVESWLNQSKLYDHFVAQATSQAQQSTGDQGDNNSVSLSDTAVQQAAQQAFSPQLLQQTVNTVLDSNYAWLQGKTATPNFSVDLTSAKQSFADQVAAFARDHLASLPVCTPAQLSQIDINNLDPLTVPCRPASVSPDAEAAQVKQKILTGGFLSNPVINANSINPNGTSNSKPYYTKLSIAPKLYRYGVKLPWAFGALSLLLILGIIFVAPTKRKGWRRTAVVLAEAGILLVLGKFAADFVFNKVESKAFNNSSVGQLQQSLTSFAHHAESELLKITLTFGIVYLVAAIAIFIFLMRSRQAAPATVGAGAPTPQSTLDDSATSSSTPVASRPTLDGTGSVGKPKTAPLLPKSKPAQASNTPKLKTRKPPRLVQ